MPPLNRFDSSRSAGYTKIVHSARRGDLVLGAYIDALSWPETLDQLVTWGRAHESRYVAICNVHVVATASRDTAYRNAINGADMATPDGAPVAWMLRRLGFPGQPRINGPDLTMELCKRCAVDALPVFFYGSTSVTLEALERRLKTALPNLIIGGLESPPFRPIAAEEDADTVARINASGAAIIFVGLGCPKQELWMAEHRGKINAVMIGVGAAFDFHAGTIKRAPPWMQDTGLEWLHRLLSDPRRLWKRYLTTNILFSCGASVQLLSQKFRRR